MARTKNHKKCKVTKRGAVKSKSPKLIAASFMRTFYREWMQPAGVHADTQSMSFEYLYSMVYRFCVHNKEAIPEVYDLLQRYTWIVVTEANRTPGVAPIRERLSLFSKMTADVMMFMNNTYCRKNSLEAIEQRVESVGREALRSLKSMDVISTDA